jgi:hypothetical protein
MVARLAGDSPVAMIPGVITVTKLDWGFPVQTLPCAEKHVGFHIKFPLPLSDSKQT